MYSTQNERDANNGRLVGLGHRRGINSGEVDDQSEGAREIHGMDRD